MKIQKVLNYFQYQNNEIKIIGSYQNEILKYYSDIDINSHVTYYNKSYKPLVNFFKRILNGALDKGIYITDFKGGYYH